MPKALAKASRTSHNTQEKEVSHVPSIPDDYLLDAVGLGRPRACGGVVVLQNWTSVKIDYALRLADGRQTHQTIAPTDIASIPTTAPIVVTLGEGPANRSYTLNVNSIHYFGLNKDGPELAHLKLPGVDGNAPADPRPGVPGTRVPAAAGPSPAARGGPSGASPAGGPASGCPDL